MGKVILAKMYAEFFRNCVGKFIHKSSKVFVLRWKFLKLLVLIVYNIQGEELAFSAKMFRHLKLRTELIL